MANGSLSGASGVYEIRNLVNGKRYVGSAVKLRRRFNEHRSDLNRGKHCNAKLQNAWNKHGAGAFEFRVLHRCRPADCVDLEQREMDIRWPEYNLSLLAGSVLGLKKTHEQIQKTVVHNIGRPLSPEHRAKVSAALVGHKLSAETKEKIAATKRGKTQSAEAREKLRACNAGKVLSAETRARMCAAQQKRQLVNPSLGRKWTEDEKTAAKERMGIFNQRCRGIPRSEETKAKLSAAHTGKRLTAAHRQAISDGHARRKATPLATT